MRSRRIVTGWSGWPCCGGSAGGMPAECRGDGSSAGSLPWLQHVLRTAAADPDCADLLETTRQQRLAGQSRVAQALAERGALADGLTEARALDIIYTLMSPEVHQILTAERHWNADQYEHWLARTLAATLLPPTDP
jgi:hypothetical protein